MSSAEQRDHLRGVVKNGYFTVRLTVTVRGAVNAYGQPDSKLSWFL